MRKKHGKKLTELKRLRREEGRDEKADNERKSERGGRHNIVML
jgi:hypothetical protein